MTYITSVHDTTGQSTQCVLRARIETTVRFNFRSQTKRRSSWRGLRFEFSKTNVWNTCFMKPVIGWRNTLTFERWKVSTRSEILCRIVRSIVEELFRHTGIDIIVYFHNPNNLTKTTQAKKTVICYFFQTLGCNEGLNCRYSHNEGDGFWFRDGTGLRRGQCNE